MVVLFAYFIFIRFELGDAGYLLLISAGSVVRHDHTILTFNCPSIISIPDFLYALFVLCL